jgi:adenine-specific DNA methylase
LLDYNKSFIEVQFPVSRISKESYKERKAVASQTLTGLGKWWGRKPLVMVRATLLGVLMPVSDDYTKDREIFLKIMTMDKEGLWLRKHKNISKKKLWQLTNEEEKEKYFREGSTAKKPKYPKGMSRDNKKAMKEELQKTAFNRLSYDDKLSYCRRPEEVELTDESEWKIINEHLKTNASNLQELIQELGRKRFGHIPKVGDCFAGGGSIPFEAARMGAESFGSDLNPISGLLTWASINIAGASSKKAKELKKFQKELFNDINKEIRDLGIEENEKGDKAHTYLYCNETKCPECGINVPLSPTWILEKRNNSIVILEKDQKENKYKFNVVNEATEDQRKEAENQSTIKGNKLFCPNCKNTIPISIIRGDKKVDDKMEYGLNLWEENQFLPKENNIFKERLYAIRYIDENNNIYYSSPSKKDIEREAKIIKILSENFNEWKKKGFIPSDTIIEGYNTEQLIRERGWKYWHQLFNHRQLLYNILVLKNLEEKESKKRISLGILCLNKILNWNSRLSRWDNSGSPSVKDTFYNQALNTMFNYSTRGSDNLRNVFEIDFEPQNITTNNQVKVKDARDINEYNDIWITDPPYADAVNYHELSEFFLAWDKPLLKKSFPEWYTDSKRVLAVKGTGESFNESMIEVYKNLADNMPNNGYQVVMFTHQDVKVWSELTMILWSAGLKVASAWNISTETPSGGLKEGNYVKGTVLLVLQKQTSNDFAFQDEVYDEIQIEVRNMIDSMKGIDYKDIPDFTDADYLLASYAAALKVLTGYGEIDGIDIDYWLSGDRNEESPVEKLIKKARDVANSYLIPEEFEKNHWFELSNAERFFIRGLELEMNNEHTIGAYQELAKGFGVKEYKTMFHNFEANNVRLKTPSEYKMSYLDNEFNEKDFSGSLLRHLLVAVLESAKNTSTNSGRTYLKGVFNQSQDYWYKKPLMREILTFISKIEMVDHMEHWHEEAKYARLLREALKNEGV